MSQRLPGITDEAATGPTKDLFEASNILLGRTANLQRILSHSPLVARWFLPLVAAVRQPTAGAVSDVRLRNLACLQLLNAAQQSAWSSTGTHRRGIRGATGGRLSCQPAFHRQGKSRDGMVGGHDTEHRQA
jgi:hypothetical protein